MTPEPVDLAVIHGKPYRLNPEDALAILEHLRVAAENIGRDDNEGAHALVDEVLRLTGGVDGGEKR